VLPASSTARGARGEVLRWALAMALVVAAGYFAAVSFAFWIWVANSAFRGIREEQSIGLGVVCVCFVVAPAAGSAVAYRIGRPRRSTRRGIARAAATMLVLQTISFVCGAIASGPF